MTLFSYNLNIPAGTDNPSDDRPLMTENTNSTAGIIAVDHVGFDITNGGYHTISHQIPQSVPSAIAGIGQLFSQNITVGSSTDTQLFYMTGQGSVSQLTGAFVSSPGYQWIGDVLLQWGLVIQVFAAGSTAVSATFKIPFPHNCFIVIGTPFWNNATPTSTSAASLSINSFSINNVPSGGPTVTPPITGFSGVFTTANSTYRGFYWIAIGN